MADKGMVAELRAAKDLPEILEIISGWFGNVGTNFENDAENIQLSLNACGGDPTSALAHPSDMKRHIEEALARGRDAQHHALLFRCLSLLAMQAG